MKNIKILKRLLFVIIIVYIMSIFINQQKTLNAYKNTQDFYKAEIETKLAYQDSLYETKNNINSDEFIEEMAREKLDMYLPNERVYIDTDK